MTRAVLSIGSNLGDRLAALRSVISGLGPSVIGVSSVYETSPWGLLDQPDFLNAVVVADDPTAEPDEWLRRAHDFEQTANRTRELHWGPRTLDVDIIDVDGLVSADPTLTLPHPRAAERAFVLIPWSEVDDDPKIAAMVAALPVDERDSVHRRPEFVLR